MSRPNVAEYLDVLVKDLVSNRHKRKQIQTDHDYQQACEDCKRYK